MQAVVLTSKGDRMCVGTFKGRDGYAPVQVLDLVPKNPKEGEPSSLLLHQLLPVSQFYHQDR